MDKARILVVDDELVVCEMLKQFLTDMGYEVRYANSGTSAFETFKEFSPHFIFLDVIMPEMSGLEVLQKIREVDKETKVIMISGMHDLGMAKEAISLGALDYITKPIELGYLSEFIKEQMIDLFGSEKNDLDNTKDDQDQSEQWI